MFNQTSFLGKKTWAVSLLFVQKSGYFGDLVVGRLGSGSTWYWADLVVDRRGIGLTWWWTDTVTRPVFSAKRRGQFRCCLFRKVCTLVTW